MNIYKMKYKEYEETRREFLRTPFGVGVSIFSLLPFILTVALILFSVLCFAVEENEIAGILYLVGSFAGLYCCCITQLLYSSFLKDFVNSKEKK